MIPRHAVVPVLVALVAACGGEGASHPDATAGARQGVIRVLAASDLQLALPEIAAGFHARTGIPVELVFGSTGNLATQIENGAPADLFLAANESFVDRLDRGGHTDPASRRLYAVGRLAIAWPRGTPEPSGLASLAGPAYRTVAIANPEHAPYGAAAREALREVGVWDTLARRLVLAENVAQVLQFVRSRNADAGIVAFGVVLGQPDIPHRVVDAHLHAPLLQAGVVLRGTARPAEAAALLDELAGEAGQAILRRTGFDPPP
jgi:molybdate transport system substrate-binding protein